MMLRCRDSYIFHNSLTPHLTNLFPLTPGLISLVSGALAMLMSAGHDKHHNSHGPGLASWWECPVILARPKSSQSANCQECAFRITCTRNEMRARALTVWCIEPFAGWLPRHSRVTSIHSPSAVLYYTYIILLIMRYWDILIKISFNLLCHNPHSPNLSPRHKNKNCRKSQWLTVIILNKTHFLNPDILFSA